MDPRCHKFDVEARDSDRLRDPLGAGITLAASFGAELEQASGPASVLSPEGVAAQPPVRAKGPRARRGERARATIDSERVDSQERGPVSRPSKGKQCLGVDPSDAITLENHSAGVSSDSAAPDPARQGPPKASTGTETRCVGCRVDAFYLAFTLQVTEPILDEIRDRQAVADEVGEAELRLGDFTFHMRRSRARDVTPFRNSDVRGALVQGERQAKPDASNINAAGYQTLELEYFATYLARHSLGEALATALRIATTFGAVQETRTRRVDLAADFVGYPLGHADLDGYLTQRARKTSFVLTEAKDEGESYSEAYSIAAREHRKAGNQVTGFAFAPGNTLSARVYDKSEELRLPGRDAKRAIEEETWTRNGWDGVAQVTRIEFQARSMVLREWDLRNPDELEKALDAVWQYCVVNWLRLVSPGTASRLKNCVLDARWEAVKAITFSHVAQPRSRSRTSGGATVEHASGAMRSFVASNNRLQRIELVTSDGEVLSREHELIDSMPPAAQEAFVRRELRSLTAYFLHDATDEYIQKYGAGVAALKLLVAHNATVARFSNLDDRPLPRDDNELGKLGEECQANGAIEL